MNHVANGQSHAEPVDPPRDPSPVPDQQDSRPPSRSRHHKADKRGGRTRGSGEIPNEQQRHSISPSPEKGVTTLSVPTPTPQLTTVDRGKPQGHATANHNSNAASSSHREITPRWFKPSETKLEAVKAAAARDVQVSRGTSPAPSSPDTVLHHRPRSKGFIPGSNRGSNASQYDNVPGMPEQEFEILELERPPSRMRAHGSETPFSVSSSLNQESPSRGASLAGSVVSVSGARMAKHPLPPQLSCSSPMGVQTSYPANQNEYHTPNKNTTEVPIFHPAYSVNLDHRGQERLYAPPSRFPPPSNEGYVHRPYATTQRKPISLSPEKALMNNSFATYRRQPAPSTHNHQSTKRSPEHALQLATHGTSTPIYLQQFTSTSQGYAPADNRFEGPRSDRAHLKHRAVDGLLWSPEEDEPPRSPGGMPRSPSFQQAQMSPVQEFTFPTDPDLVHYRTQFQEQQPNIRQHLPQLFGGPHYRHAQEAFAMQESMLL